MSEVLICENVAEKPSKDSMTLFFANGPRKTETNARTAARVGLPRGAALPAPGPRAPAAPEAGRSGRPAVSAAPPPGDRGAAFGDLAGASRCTDNIAPEYFQNNFVFLFFLRNTK